MKETGMYCHIQRIDKSSVDIHVYQMKTSDSRSKLNCFLIPNITDPMAHPNSISWAITIVCCMGHSMGVSRAPSQYEDRLIYVWRFPCLKIRRPLGRLIFNMGIAIPGKTVFLIETAPWSVGTRLTYQTMGNKHKILLTHWHFELCEFNI